MITVTYSVISYPIFKFSWQNVEAVFDIFFVKLEYFRCVGKLVNSSTFAATTIYYIALLLDSCQQHK